jgi:HEPN domain-containing protein
MKKDKAEAARQLAGKAENDLRSAKILLAQDGPIDAIAFHLQQAAEKLLKAFLTLHGIEYPFTHDIGELLLMAVEPSPRLAQF